MDNVEEEEDEEEAPEDTDEYADQSPNGRWFRRDQPVSDFISNICLVN